MKMATYDQQQIGGIITNPYGAWQQFQYANNMMRPQQTQPLTEEEIAQLRTNGGEFDISLTQDELLRGFCTHKDPKTGALTLIRNNDNTLTCSICQQTFNEEDLSKENAEAIVKRFIDLLQTIKAAYPDIPVTTARQFFSIIPLAKKVPSLAYFATQNMSRYQSATMVAPGQSPYGFNALGAVMGGPSFPGYGMPGYGIPNYGAPAGAVPYGYQPQYGQGVAPQAGQAPNMGQVQQQPSMPYGMPYQQFSPYGVPVAPQQVPVTPSGNEFGYYGNDQMARPIVPPQNLNIQVPGVYPAATGANGQPVYMPNTQPVVPQAPQAPVQQVAPQNVQAVQNTTPVSAPPNTATASMPMATPVADPNAGKVANQGVTVDPNNFSL